MAPCWRRAVWGIPRVAKFEDRAFCAREHCEKGAQPSVIARKRRRKLVENGAKFWAERCDPLPKKSNGFGTSLELACVRYAPAGFKGETEIVRHCVAPGFHNGFFREPVHRILQFDARQAARVKRRPFFLR